MSGNYSFMVILTVSIAAVAALLTLLFSPFLHFTAGENDLAALTVPARDEWKERVALADYLPPRPADAPPALRPSVLSGQRLMAAARHTDRPANGQLTCASCHFRGGLTDGGRNGGISLVGVAAKYPLPRSGQERLMTLAERINACFVTHLDADPLPADGREMADLLAYFQWVSKGIPTYAEVSWLGAPRLTIDRAARPEAGPGIFSLRCAMCHGVEGQGTAIAPPSWGPGSFTTAGDMNRPEILAGFIHDNMPRDNPILSPAEAQDVAAFIAAQPRPRPKTAKPTEEKPEPSKAAQPQKGTVPFSPASPRE